jgi:hypothetical protein
MNADERKRIQTSARPAVVGRQLALAHSRDFNAT